MNSNEAINQNFVPYSYNFPSITFVVNDHECEMLSLCCGAESNEYIDNMCGACNESVTFECNDCEEADV